MSSNNIPLKLLRGYKDNLPTTIEDGMIYYCIDSNELFFDYVNNSTTPPTEYRYCLNPMVGETDYGDPVGKGLVSPEDKEIIDTAIRFVEQHLEPEQQKQARLNIGAVGEKTLEGGEIFNDYNNNFAMEYAHAEGQSNVAIGKASHVEGLNNSATGEASHSEGFGLGYVALSTNVDAGSKTFIVNSLGNLEKNKYINLNNEIRLIIEIDTSTMMITVDLPLTKSARAGNLVYLSGAIGKASHTEGQKTFSIGISGHAEGQETLAFGNNSHAEGQETLAFGNNSHAEGLGKISIIKFSGAPGETIYTVSEGIENLSVGSLIEYKPIDLSNSIYNTVIEINNISNTFTVKNTFDSSNLIIEGLGIVYNGIAMGNNSHVEGYYSNAIGNNSHAEGKYTNAFGENQHVLGRYNIEDTENKYAHIIGNGNENNLSNAHTIDWNGNAWFAGTLKIGGAAYDDETAAKVLTNLDLPNENDALELLYDMNIIEPITDENGLILTDENGNILTSK